MDWLSRLGAGPARPLLRYAAIWLGAGLVVALVVVLLADPDGGRGRTTGLPAVQQTDLEEAAATAGCRLQRGARGNENPPISGPPGEPARPEAFPRSPPVRSLVAALRRGIVVIHYRPGLEPEVVEELAEIREGVPEGTILAPNATGMPFAVAATAHERLLGCERYTEQTPDALRLFRGRYIGQGPDR